MKRQLFPLIAFSALLFLAACEEEDENNSNPPAGDPTVSLRYDFNYNGDDFNLNQYYPTEGGAQWRFTLASFYLAKPAIMDDAGNATMLMPEYLIVRPENESSDLGTVAAGHAHMFNIIVGVDEATNTENGAEGKQPSDFSDANHPLSPQPEGMYWSWASGYIFVKLEGEIDYDGDNQADTTFKYHLGTNNLRLDMSTMVHGDLAPGEELEMTMAIDYGMIEDNLDLNTEILTMTMNNVPLAEKVMANFEKAISFSHRIKE